MKSMRSAPWRPALLAALLALAGCGNSRTMGVTELPEPPPLVPISQYVIGPGVGVVYAFAPNFIIAPLYFYEASIFGDPDRQDIRRG